MEVKDVTLTLQPSPYPQSAMAEVQFDLGFSKNELQKQRSFLLWVGLYLVHPQHNEDAPNPRTGPLAVLPNQLWGYQPHEAWEQTPLPQPPANPYPPYAQEMGFAYNNPYLQPEMMPAAMAYPSPMPYAQPYGIPSYPYPAMPEQHFYHQQPPAGFAPQQDPYAPYRTQGMPLQPGGYPGYSMNNGHDAYPQPPAHGYPQEGAHGSAAYSGSSPNGHSLHNPAKHLQDEVHHDEFLMAWVAQERIQPVEPKMTVQRRAVFTPQQYGRNNGQIRAFVWLLPEVPSYGNGWSNPQSFLQSYTQPQPQPQSQARP